MKQWQCESEEQTKDLGRRLGVQLCGGELIELVGDVGAGKTTFTKGLAEALGVTEPVQSPTFTISRVYPARDGLELRHYDFYRLSEAGILADELKEVLESEASVTVVEWGGAVRDALAVDRLRISLVPTSETARSISVESFGEHYTELLEQLS